MKERIKHAYRGHLDETDHPTARSPHATPRREKVNEQARVSGHGVANDPCPHHVHNARPGFPLRPIDRRTHARTSHAGTAGFSRARVHGRPPATLDWVSSMSLFSRPRV